MSTNPSPPSNPSDGGGADPNPNLRPCRGPNYSTVEDLLICKAFITTSEDPIHGTSQRGKTFKENMHKNYLARLKEQVAYEKNILSSSSAATRSEYQSNGFTGLPYKSRTANSIYDRFKTKISGDTMKYCGIYEMTERGSGTNEEDFRETCLAIFARRTGNVFDFLKCWDYLKDKAKYACFRRDMAAAESKKAARPIGTKQAKEAKKEAAMIKAAVDLATKEGNVADDGDPTAATAKAGKVSDEFFTKCGGFLDNCGTALMSYMTHMKDDQFFGHLDSPDKFEFAREHMKLRTAQMKSKRLSLEDEKPAAKKPRAVHDVDGDGNNDVEVLEIPCRQDSDDDSD